MRDERMDEYDAVVVGGGAAGLNGAMMLARSRRSVLVIDGGEPRNAPAQAVHGLLGHDGISPAALLERGREEVRTYGGQVRQGTVAAARSEGTSFVLELDDGSTVRARRLLIATGVVDVLPQVPGLADRWGRDVLHCPYCHGWEVRDRAIGVLATLPTMAVHQALLFRQLSDDVVVFAHGAVFDDEQRETLTARSIRIVDDEVVGLDVRDDRLRGVRLSDGPTVPRDALVVAARGAARVGPFAALGLHAVDHPSGMGSHLPADATGRADVPGVWVAGNATDLMGQVGAAAAAGAMAGAQINADLVMEEARVAM